MEAAMGPRTPVDWARPMVGEPETRAWLGFSPYTPQ